MRRRRVLVFFAAAQLAACGLLGDSVLGKAKDADVVDIHESYDRKGAQLFVHLERRGARFEYESSFEEKGGPRHAAAVDAAVVDRFLRAVGKAKRGEVEETRLARWEERRIHVTIRPRGGGEAIGLDGTGATWRWKDRLVAERDHDELSDAYEALVTSIERPKLP